jgi:phosphate transport system substrate-binding protein
MDDSVDKRIPIGGDSVKKHRRFVITHTRMLLVFAAVNAIGLAVALGPASEAGAAAPSLESTGSSFAAVAIQQWVGEAATLYGLNINFQVSSSVIGLDDFGESQIDFAASDIPYSSGQAQSTPTQPYQYLPDVAGALSFMYNLQGGESGTHITNLVLTPQLIEDIFTGVITQWNDPLIKQANPQIAQNLPSTTIIPVYRVDASGENYLLSSYLLQEENAAFTAYQTAFAGNDPGSPTATWPSLPAGVSAPPGYPGWSASNLVGQSGSDAAANYVAANSSNGAITYVETAYAIENKLPVASVVNADGNPVQPTSVNDATALEDAVLYSNLTQNLSGVFSNPLPDAYPVSSYSYLVTPCSPNLVLASSQTKCSQPATGPPQSTSPFASAKGKALGQFVAFLACAGQQEMADLGYSPLPPNLVQEDFDAIGRMNGGVEPPPVSSATCKNPYVDGQTVLLGEPKVIGESAPPPTSTTVGSHSPGSDGSHSSGTGPGAHPSGGNGSNATSSPNGSTAGTAKPSGATTGPNGSHGNSSAASTNKYIEKAKKEAAALGASPYTRSASFRAAAAAALGLSSSAVQIGIWSVVFLAVIFLPVFLVGRRRRQLRPTTSSSSSVPEA